MWTRKKPKKRKAIVQYTIIRLRNRLARAKRLNKSENYIKDLETAIEKRRK